MLTVSVLLIGLVVLAVRHRERMADKKLLAMEGVGDLAAKAKKGPLSAADITAAKAMYKGLDPDKKRALHDTMAASAQAHGLVDRDGAAAIKKGQVSKSLAHKAIQKVHKAKAKTPGTKPKTHQVPKPPSGFKKIPGSDNYHKALPGGEGYEYWRPSTIRSAVNKHTRTAFLPPLVPVAGLVAEEVVSVAVGAIFFSLMKGAATHVARVVSKKMAAKLATKITEEGSKKILRMSTNEAVKLAAEIGEGTLVNLAVETGRISYKHGKGLLSKNPTEAKAAAEAVNEHLKHEAGTHPETSHETAKKNMSDPGKTPKPPPEPAPAKEETPSKGAPGGKAPGGKAPAGSKKTPGPKSKAPAPTGSNSQAPVGFKKIPGSKNFHKARPGGGYDYWRPGDTAK